MKDIEPRDKNNLWHGYQEWYGIKLLSRGVYKHGRKIGYRENHSWGFTNFFIR